MLDEQRSKCLIGYWTISDRIMLVKLKGKPFDISINKYMHQLPINQKKKMSHFTMISKWPNLNVNPNTLSSLWETLMLKLAMKDMRIQLDLMALATEMKAEKKMIEWAKSHGMIIGNTWFEQHPKRLCVDLEESW